MASCEKCWKDAKGDPILYIELITKRECTPEEQAGEEAKVCPKCFRKTIHQYVGKCMFPECVQVN